MVKIYANEVIFKSHEPFQSNQVAAPANSARKAGQAGPVSWLLCKGSWDLKMISMANIFTIIFVSNLVSNLCKNFMCIAQHQKPTVSCDIRQLKLGIQETVIELFFFLQELIVSKDHASFQFFCKILRHFIFSKH